MKRRKMARFGGRISNILTGIAILAALVVLLRLFPQDLPGDVSGAARVIDGDSLSVEGHEIRLVGLDAPEFDQRCEQAGQSWPCGRRAREALRGLTRGREVACRVEGYDRYSRLLARCRAGDTDINRTLVAEGWAVSTGDYALEESAAERSGKGLWRGEFDRPADHRAGRGIFGWLAQLWWW